MRLLLTLVGSIAVAAAAIGGAQTAAAHGTTCGPPSTARVTSHATAKTKPIVDFAQKHPEGVPLSSAELRRPGHFYELTAAVTLELQGNMIWASKGSILSLGCYGRTKTSPKLPAVVLLRGTLKLSTVAGKPAGVITEEGLFDPRTDETMIYTVKRVLTKRGDVNLVERLKWFANFGDQPMGTTTIASTQLVGVTPYVGANPGTCRYVHGATLRTTQGYGRGTATYRP